MKRIVVVGAGIGGLVAGIRAARLGMEVTIVERDGAPPTDAEVFEGWDRRHVPQFTSPHTLSARVHGLLAMQLPDVLDDLAAAGMPVTNLFMMVCPPELQEPDDRRFTQLVARRPVLEAVLHRTAAHEPGVSLRTGVAASGLVWSDHAQVPTVIGVRMDGGDVLLADVVIDAGGRRSPVAGWLDDAGVSVQTAAEPSGVVYHSRHYRCVPGAPMPTVFVVGARNRADHVRSMGFPGDDDTYSIAINTASWDDRTRDLRHAWAFEAVAELFPLVRPWVQPNQGVPISDVATVVGASNRLRTSPPGDPGVLGLLSIGDALSTTNPENGWGATMAVEHALAACDAIAANHDDLAAVTERYYRSVESLTTAVFAESAAIDRLRNRRWAGHELEPDDAETAERVSLIEDGVQPALLHDHVLARAFLRRVNLIDHPTAIFDDPELVRRAQTWRDRTLAATNTDPITIDDVCSAIERARPTSLTSS